MEHRNYTLDEILEVEATRQNPDFARRPETLVLADTSILAQQEIDRKSNTLFDEALLDASYFHEVDADKARKMTAAFTNLLNTTRYGPMKITPQISEQFETLARKVNNKTGKILHTESHRINRPSSRPTRAHRTDEQSGIALQEMTHVINQAIKQLSHKQYPPNNPLQYRQMTTAIAACWHPENTGQFRSLADDSLVAAMLYHTFFKGRPSAVVTCDHDIAYLLNKVRKHLSSKDMPYATHVIEAVSTNACRVYFGRGPNEYIAELDTSVAIAPFTERGHGKKERENLALEFLRIGVYKPLLERTKETSSTLQAQK